MRIAEIATLLRPVPPAGAASVESLVSLITEGLVERGHDVTLYALEESTTAGRLRSPVKESYTRDGSKWDWQLYEAYQVREAFRAWRDFDVIHCHSYYFGLLFCDFISVPSLHSVHIEPGPDYVFLAERTHNRHVHFCSRYQARAFADIAGVHIIPHGIAIEDFRFGPDKEREHYILFLGRFIPEKGPLEAIHIARQTGLTLKLAGAETDYFRTVIRPEVDGRAVEYLGEVKRHERAELLAKSRALVYPVQRGEAFGLVLVEAMASGTPVVAFNCGAVPEIVEHGVTGWIGETEKELVEALQRVDALDRHRIRRLAEERFSAERMVDQLERVLKQIVEGSQR